MAKELVGDALWAEVAPLLPLHKAEPGKGSRPPVSGRACLAGVLFGLKSGIPGEMLPAEMNGGSGMTCWRRLGDWQKASVWKGLHAVFLSKLREAVR